MGRKRKSQLNDANEDKDSNVKKHERMESLVVRRSNRLRGSTSASPPSDSLGIKPLVEQAEAEHQMEKEKEREQVFARQDSPEMNYKNLYINSQKKIESLMEENYDLVRRLKFALGKISAYEMMKIVVSPRGNPMDATSSLSPKKQGKKKP